MDMIKSKIYYIDKVDDITSQLESLITLHSHESASDHLQLGILVCDQVKEFHNEVLQLIESNYDKIVDLKSD